MSIRLTDTLSGVRKTLTPTRPGHVALYVCGPTVHDRAHVGNLRPLVVFDTLFRLLRRTYGADNVEYVSNITDVDDKIIDRAAREGCTPAEIAARFEADYLADARMLNALEPTRRPRATEHIDGMIAMMRTLEAKGAAYAVPSGLVFDVSAFSSYGKLSRRRRQEMVAGARIEPSADKRDPGDFYLWKRGRDSDPGGASWPSPWGPGRPGWHIECSAMCADILGPSIDIHGGGIDLVFPHHENEIAQSESVHGAPMAGIWMHNGHVRFGDRKMSKSVGNTLSLPALTRHYKPETIRLALLSVHYRKPLDWNDDLLRDCERRLDRLYRALEKAPDLSVGADDRADEPVLRALADDLNTPRALAELSRLVGAGGGRGTIIGAAEALGLLRMTPAQWRESAAGDGADDRKQIEMLVARRCAARRGGDWAVADGIRAQLSAMGVTVEDTSSGSTWRRTT